jgi:hypothetical protein
MGGDTDTGSAEERNLANLVVPVRDPAAHIGHLGELGPFAKRGRQYTRSESQVPTGAGWIPGRARAGPGEPASPLRRRAAVHRPVRWAAAFRQTP